MKKKILLIYPKCYVTNYSDLGSEIRDFTKRPGGIMSTTLATVAAMTPAGFEVTIIDENIETIDFDAPYDIAGITGSYSQLHRIRKLAREFSRRKVLTVCGGPLVSVSPERLRDDCQVLIIGEAENIWPRFLKDYLAGSYQAEYRETEMVDISASPLPDYSGYSQKSLRKYFGAAVQTGRGCPFGCDFCFVIQYYGRKMRYKPIPRIIREIEQLYKMKQIRFIFLADDNFTGNRRMAKDILREIRDWNRQLKKPVTFITQLSIDAAEDEEFLLLAAAAGLTMVFVGIETPNIDALKECNKNQNVKTDIRQAIKKFHQHGIQIIGAGIVGFDHDDLAIFRTQFDFFQQAGITNVNVYPYQAPDGTPLKEKIVKEGRYREWEDNDQLPEESINELNTLTIIPKQMSREQLGQGMYWLLYQFYTPRHFLQRYQVFFDDFEHNNPYLAKLRIMKAPVDFDGIKIFMRICKYLWFKGSKQEKEVFNKMLWRAVKSPHPQRYEILVENFLRLMNVQRIIGREYPGIEHITYPEPEETTGTVEVVGSVH